MQAMVLSDGYERGVVSSPDAHQGRFVIRINRGRTGKQFVRRCAVATGSLGTHQSGIVIRSSYCDGTRLHVESKQDREASTLDCLGRIVNRFNRSMTRVQSDMFDVSHDMNCVSIHKHNSGPLHARCHFGPKTFAATILQR